MNTEKILFGIGGLIIGVIVGFLFANSVNRSASEGLNTTDATVSQNPSLPPDHPPISQPSDGSAQGGALPQVTEAIEKARRSPGDFEAQMTAGDLYYQIQRFDEAADFYRKASDLRPNEIEPVIKLGNTNFDAERYEEAERWYSTVLKRTPNDVNVRTDLGLTFFLRQPRDVDRAIKEFNEALALQPDSEIALQNLSLAYAEKNDNENLQKTLARLAEVNPNNPVVVKNRSK
jgi:tetratricopeptide (TPR) repeat protein